MSRKSSISGETESLFCTTTITTMTFVILRELHAIIGSALDDIERIYKASTHNTPGRSPGTDTVSSATTTKEKCPSFAFDHGYASPPPSPSVATATGHPFPYHRPCTPSPPTLDFPALDLPCDPASPAEVLTSHPTVMQAINKIIAAAGQMTATVQTPFLSLCDASMVYHLPACLRILEASNTVEILREAGPNGLHVTMIAEKNGVEKGKLAHILRLLATHHILREVAPDVFANNRISSLVDSGKSAQEVMSSPEAKFRDTNGIAAFVGLSTDELFKSSAYITEAYLYSADAHKNTNEPTHAPFNFAFGCEGVGFFGWLEGEGIKGGRVNGPERESGMLPGSEGTATVENRRDLKPSNVNSLSNSNRYRLERFGTAMTGTDSWEVPGAVLNGFDWHALPRGSVVVDVGGGIGSTSMFLAHAFSNPTDEDSIGLKFIIQDRPIVVDMGERQWRSKCPELLDPDIAQFQVHDFFTPQPIKNAAVYFLRVILHDWPESFAQRILLRLREAAADDTKLVIADFVVPLACEDDFSSKGENGVIGAETALAPPPLLPNLGKASAHAYWMDLTMQSVFNGQERTLREIVSLAASAGWKVTKLTKAPGSLFGHIVAVPTSIPIQKRARAGSGSAFLDARKPDLRRGSSVQDATDVEAGEREVMERASSRCGTPTFGSRTELPSFEEARARFGGGFIRGLGRRVGFVPSSPSPVPKSPRHTQSTSPVTGRPAHSQPHPSAPASGTRLPPPPSPMSPRHPRLSLSRRSSFAQLSQAGQGAPPTMIPIRNTHDSNTPSARSSPIPLLVTRQTPSSPVVPRPLTHHASHAQLSPSPPSRQSHPSPVAARKPLARRASLAQLYPPASTSTSPVPPLPTRPSLPLANVPPPRIRRTSNARLDSAVPRKRSETILGLPFGASGHVRSRSRSSSILRGLQIPGAGRRIKFGESQAPDSAGPPGSATSVLEAAAMIDSQGPGYSP
ncbi:ich1-like protein [Armillaria luteobubalina]|uniref:Ich1-like protein n=1 Tax=Armillaria luteobubalina TaxID=153913 RepID=A0AA39Q3G1_9AGAR|nr:ich1-like protein [Armillaria luteobubalina]